MKSKYTKHIAISGFSVWLLLFALFPLLLMLVVSCLKVGSTQFFVWHLDFSSWQQLCSSLYFRIFLQSIRLALEVSLFCILLGYPFALALHHSAHRVKNIGLLLLLIPFWTSSLVRTYAIIGLLKAKGLLNGVLLHLHFIDSPIRLLYTHTAVVIGLTYALLPFMIVPIFLALEKIDRRLLEAAADLGAKRNVRFRRLVLPLSLPGVISGFLMVFLPAMSLFFIPDLMGGAKNLLLGNLILLNFTGARNWPLGAGMSIVLTAIMIVLLLLFHSLSNKLALKDEPL